MITVFNRKVLFQNTDAEAAAKVWSALKQNGIRYEMATKTHTSSVKRTLTQQHNIHYNAGGIPATWTEHPSAYLYIIYVHKNDYDRAKEVCDL